MDLLHHNRFICLLILTLLVSILIHAQNNNTFGVYLTSDVYLLGKKSIGRTTSSSILHMNSTTPLVSTSILPISRSHTPITLGFGSWQGHVTDLSANLAVATVSPIRKSIGGGENGIPGGPVPEDAPIGDVPIYLMIILIFLYNVYHKFSHKVCTIQK